MISTLPSISRGEIYVFATRMWGQAMMMYNLQRYADAMAVLEPLYRNIEPIDEVPIVPAHLLHFSLKKINI
jgi:hypothetical protein